MFGFDYGELAVVAIVALLVVGPKDLPKLMRTVGGWIGRARGMARHVRSGFDTMMREAEIDEMNKRWEAENEAIMRATRFDPPADQPPPPADPFRLRGGDAPDPPAGTADAAPHPLPANDAAQAPAVPPAAGAHP